MAKKEKEKVRCMFFAYLLFKAWRLFSPLCFTQDNPQKQKKSTQVVTPDVATPDPNDVDLRVGHYNSVRKNLFPEDPELSKQRKEHDEGYSPLVVNQMRYELAGDIGKMYICPSAKKDANPETDPDPCGCGKPQCCFNLCGRCFVKVGTVRSRAKRQRKAEAQSFVCHDPQDGDQHLKQLLRLVKEEEYNAPAITLKTNYPWLDCCSRCGLKWFDKDVVV